ncbi:hypothetical protein SFR_3785 [Streptomyces sp. FR-008]|nr:hypothetical protein SFR_3785 [Streptomyces sp. FR-008]
MRLTPLPPSRGTPAARERWQSFRPGPPGGHAG